MRYENESIELINEIDLLLQQANIDSYCLSDLSFKIGESIKVIIDLEY